MAGNKANITCRLANKIYTRFAYVKSKSHHAHEVKTDFVLKTEESSAL